MLQSGGSRWLKSRSRKSLSTCTAIRGPLWAQRVGLPGWLFGLQCFPGRARRGELHQNRGVTFLALTGVEWDPGSIDSLSFSIGSDLCFPILSPISTLTPSACESVLLSISRLTASKECNPLLREPQSVQLTPRRNSISCHRQPAVPSLSSCELFPFWVGFLGPRPASRVSLSFIHQSWRPSSLPAITCPGKYQKHLIVSLHGPRFFDVELWALDSLFEDASNHPGLIDDRKGGPRSRISFAYVRIMTSRVYQ